MKLRGEFSKGLYHLLLYLRRLPLRRQDDSTTAKGSPPLLLSLIPIVRDPDEDPGVNWNWIGFRIRRSKNRGFRQEQSIQEEQDISEFRIHSFDGLFSYMQRPFIHYWPIRPT